MQPSERNCLCDEQLAVLIREGDQLAFEVIYWRYQRLLYALALKYLKSGELAEDAVQHIYLQLWSKRDSLSAEMSLKGYLCTSLKNHVLNAIRNHRRAILNNLEIAVRTDYVSNETEKTVHLTDFSRVAAQGIDQLSPRKRLIFQLRSEDGLSPREIASQLGLSINTVKFQLSQATRALRTYLKQHADITIILLLLLPPIA